MRVPRKALLVLAVIITAALALTAAGRLTIYQTKQTMPISLGTSGGNVNDISSMYCCSGTLGSLVSKGGQLYILSNNHILARSDQASPGEDISQPGMVDSNCSTSNSNLVADFSSAPKLGTNVDAALAATNSTKVKGSGEILGVGVPASTMATPAINMGVAKAGRTTGLTCDTIDATNLAVNVQYQKGCGVGATFIVSYDNQVLINGHGFSAGGDSGSLIVTSAGAQPVGLLFAGSSSSTIANPIQEVASALGVSFVGGAAHSVTCATKGGGKKNGIGPRSFSRALYAKQLHAPQLMLDEGVMAVGVGADDEDPTQAAVVVVVEAGRQLRQAIPAHLNGVKTKVLLSDKIRAYGWNEPEGRACRK